MTNFISYTTAYTTRMVILHTSNGTFKIPSKDIVRIQSISNYSKIFMSNGKSLVVAKLLHYFEQHPDLDSFLRIHRTHLVNVGYIKCIEINKSCVIHLDNGETITVARRKKTAVAQRLNDFGTLFPGLTDSAHTNKKVMAA